MFLIALVCVSVTSMTLARCAKEYSCEGERCGYYKDTFLTPPLGPITRWPPRDTTNTVDTTDTIPADTVYNDLIAYYDFYIVDNSRVRKMYFAVQTKYIPGHYQLIDTIPIQQRPDGYYTGSFDIKSYKLGAGIANLGRIYYDSCFKKGDVFRYFFEIRYKDATHLRSDTVTLIL